MQRCILIGMLIGVAAEIVARAFKLWSYRQSQTPVLNVLVMFGLVMGAIASVVPRIGMAEAFAAAFAVGLVYEIANLRLLKWWAFPDERLAFIRGHTAIVIVTAVLWGAVPVIIAGGGTVLPGGRRTLVGGQSRLDGLAERERQLLEKLDAAQQREREIQTRLEDLRALKATLLGRRTHQVGTAEPLPTPWR